MSKIKRTIPRETRELVLKKLDGHCAYCGCKLTLKSMQVDHIVSVKYGGKDVLNNYFPACASCNLHKGHMSIKEYKRSLKLFAFNIRHKSSRLRIIERLGGFNLTVDNLKFYFEKKKED